MNLPVKGRPRLERKRFKTLAGKLKKANVSKREFSRQLGINAKTFDEWLEKGIPKDRVHAVFDLTRQLDI